MRAAIRAKFPDRQPEFDLALNTGLRLSELLGLTWNDVDLRLNLLTLRKTKGGKLQRVPLNSEATKALLKLRALNPKSDHVCPAYEVRKDAGTVDFHWHDLRHTSRLGWS